MKINKYRAFNKKTKKFQYFTLEDCFNSTGGYLGDYLSSDEIENITDYTNRKDKNNKEIYENDVIRSLESCNKGQYYSYDTVEYIGGGFSPLYCNGCEATTKVEDMEVVGNIYENPELIKVVEKSIQSERLGEPEILKDIK